MYEKSQYITYIPPLCGNQTKGTGTDKLRQINKAVQFPFATKIEGLSTKEVFDWPEFVKEDTIISEASGCQRGREGERG